MSSEEGPAATTDAAATDAAAATTTSEVTIISDADTIEKALLQCAADKKLSESVVISSDGTTLTVNSGGSSTQTTVFSALTKLRATVEDKSCEYTAASIYLQVVNPDQGLLAYRNACKQYNVADPVKPLEKKIVVAYFLGATAAAAGGETTPAAAAGATTGESSSTAAAAAAAAAAEEAAPTTASAKDKAEEAKRDHEDDEDDDDDRRKDKDKARSSSSHSHHNKDKHHKSSSSSDRHSGSSSKRKHGSSSGHRESSSPNKKKVKKEFMVTNEQLMEHLDVVVDKRKIDPDDKHGNDAAAAAAANDDENKNDPSKAPPVELTAEMIALKQQQEQIRKALSAEGFQLATTNTTTTSTENAENKEPNKTVIQPEHKERTATILANEIPVGNSASILRANNPRKDLTRVLELYLETIAAPNSKKGGAGAATAGGGNNKSSTGIVTSPGGGRVLKPYLIGKKPVIVVPKGMTAPLTMINAHEFLANAKFVPRDIMMKQQAGKRTAPQTTFTRQIRGSGGGSGSMAGGSGSGGAANAGLLEYEITDNPRKVLGPNPKEWERLVAVIVLGQSWQFKDWCRHYSQPATLFHNVFGFYVSMEGNKEPPEVAGWAVTRSYLSRDKRGLDSITFASFWNTLDEWMRVYKPELLPQTTGKD